MMIQRSARQWFAVGLLVAFGSAASAADLFVNGNFETATNYGQFKLGGDTSITGWTTVLSGVEYFDTTGFGGSPAGKWAVDLANFTYQTGGGIEQTVDTVAGTTYDVSFLAGNTMSSGRDGTGIVKVSIDGAAPLSFATAAASGFQMVWAQRSFSFTATGTHTTIRFWNDQNPFAHFAVIDGTAIQAQGATTAPVPEPSTYALMAMGLVAVGAFGRRRTPQAVRPEPVR